MHLKIAKIFVPFLNKEIWSQLNSSKQRGDLRLINLQKHLQKGTIAIVQNTDKLLVDDRVDKKDLLKTTLVH